MIPPSGRGSLCWQGVPKQKQSKANGGESHACHQLIFKWFASSIAIQCFGEQSTQHPQYGKGQKEWLFNTHAIFCLLASPLSCLFAFCLIGTANISRALCGMLRGPCPNLPQSRTDRRPPSAA